QEHPPLFFRTAVFAAVLRSPQGQNHRTRPLGQQPLQVDLAVDVVEPQFDQWRALLDQVLVFRDHVAMATASDTYANHGQRTSVVDSAAANCGPSPAVALS